MKSFEHKLGRRQNESGSILCVGLDPDLDRIPTHLTDQYPPVEAVIRFNKGIIDATHSLAAAFKLNLAFFEAFGTAAPEILTETLRAIPDDCITIADGKRGDIGNSARKYAEATFLQWDFDACTVTPYLGEDSIAPFLQYAERGVYVLGLTSNSGSQDFQHLNCHNDPLYMQVAERTQHWSKQYPGSTGLVVGGTQPAELEKLRDRCPTLPFLIPGIGAQGGDAERAVKAGTGDGALALINSSRSIIYASETDDFQEAAKTEAERMRNQFRRILKG